MLGQEQGHLHMTAVFLAAADRARDDPLPAGRARRTGHSAGASACSSGSSSGSRPSSSSRRRSCSRSRSRSPTGSSRRRGSGSAPLAAASRPRSASPPSSRRRSSTTRRPASSRQSINTRRSSTATSRTSLLPTQFIWAGGVVPHHVSYHFRGNATEAGAYLGLPTLVIIVLYALGVAPLERSCATCSPRSRPPRS